jgi:hypothetical protein
MSTIYRHAVNNLETLTPELLSQCFNRLLSRQEDLGSNPRAVDRLLLSELLRTVFPTFPPVMFLCFEHQPDSVQNIGEQD